MPMAHRKGSRQEQQRIACDQCHRRKVRCEGNQPCEKCTSANLQCTRQLVRKRRGPKKGSGSVIAQLRSSDHGFDDARSTPPLESPSYASYGSSILEDGYIPSPSATNFSGSPTITFSGLVPSSQPWTHGGPPLTRNNSDDQFLTVNELAQRILKEDDFFSPHYRTSSPAVIQNGGHVTSPRAALNRSYPPPTSIEALLAPTSQPYQNSYPAAATSSPFQSQFAVQKPYIMSQAGDVAANLAIVTGMSANDGPIMSQCVDLYFSHLYSTMPVIHEPSFRKVLNSPTTIAADDKSLVLAVCAITIICVGPPTNLGWEVRRDMALRFLQQFVQVRTTYEYPESSTLPTIVSSYLVHTAYFEMKKFHASWFYLREAIGMALEIGLDDEEKNQLLGPIDQVIRRRTFALLFVSERGAAILRNKPVSMKSLREIPSGIFEEDEPAILTGFQALCQLFGLLDEKFIEYWNTPHSQEPDLQPRASVDIASIQSKLNAFEFEFAGTMDEVQKADIMISRCWLRLVVWQAAMRQGLLSSHAEDPAFTYWFPMDIARSLCDVLSQVSIEAVLVHGMGIFEKVFEVAYSLMDTLSLSKASRPSSLDDLKFLFRCLSASPTSHETYVKVLVSKYNGQQALPHVASPEILQPSGSPWITTPVEGSTPNSQRPPTANT